MLYFIANSLKKLKKIIGEERDSSAGVGIA
jgi:hypothetical protein